MKRDWNKIFNECMTELYAHAEPKADFNELIKFAEDNDVRDKRGKLIIPYDDYEIEEKTFNSIFDSIVKKYKIKSELGSFSLMIYLGCSPKYKHDKD